MIAFRPFTREDWYGFAGAETFGHGIEPLISTFKVVVPENNDMVEDAVAIIDASGLTVHWTEPYFDDCDRADEATRFAYFEGPLAVRAVAQLSEGMSVDQICDIPGAEVV